MRRIGPILSFALLLGAAPLAAQDAPPPPQRQELEAQVFRRFVGVAADRLELRGAERERFTEILRTYAGKRQQLARRGAELHRALNDAARDPRTPDAQYRRVLTDMTALRDEENRLWKDEQAALAPVLTPRQQAMLLLLRARMAERVNEMRRPAAPDRPMQPGRPRGRGPGGF